MYETKKYLENMFSNFERMGYTTEQIIDSLYDYYNGDLETTNILTNNTL